MTRITLAGGLESVSLIDSHSPSIPPISRAWKVWKGRFGIFHTYCLGSNRGFGSTCFRTCFHTPILAGPSIPISGSKPERLKG
jgi:hypothetical protein